MCHKKYGEYETEDLSYIYPKRYDETIEFFKRLDDRVDFKGKTVIDIGCGLGSTCLYMALKGAKKVVGIEINEEAIKFARNKQKTDHKNLSNIVDFRLPDKEIHEKFDIVISKDSFEHYEDPENIIITMKQYLKRDGIIVIGFGPLWKSPHGGHISGLTKIPWAHLIFPESIIINELKHFLADDEIESFKDVAGGLNKMTFKRYLNLIKNSDLNINILNINVSTRPKERIIFTLFNVMNKIWFLREYFTVNLYSILKIPREET